jgi:hypothetical protein
MDLMKNRNIDLQKQFSNRRNQLENLYGALEGVKGI